MTYTVGFKAQFALEYARFPGSQQDAVDDFIALFMQHGLGDQTKYPGRVTPSWLNLPTNDPDYQFAFNNELWHYHVGIPTYSGTQSWGKTSDWVLHFQWLKRGNHVDLVDMYQHYQYGGKFYMPDQQSLVAQPPAADPDTSPQA